MIKKLNILIAILYPVAVIAGFVLTIRIDNFAIFDPTYATLALVILPGLLILLVIGLAFTGRAPGRLWRVALIAWIVFVTYGHQKLIEIAASGV